MLTRATEAVGVLALALVLAGCSEPPPPKTFVLWEIADLYVGGIKAIGQPTRTTELQVEGGLDRIACEMLQTKRTERHRAYGSGTVVEAREGASSQPKAGDVIIAVYRCLPTGLAPKDAPPL